MPLLRCPKSELNLGIVLLNGQTFRWQKCIPNKGSEADDSKDCFVGIAKHRLWKLWRENDLNIGYEVLSRFDKCSGEDESILRDYFKLDIQLGKLYKKWTKNNEIFKKAITANGSSIEGIRILAQNPVETLFAFICSSNNNIKRITKMVESLCELYGESKTLEGMKFYDKKLVYDFADINKMAEDDEMETKLRKYGFGYRAKYLHQTAKKLAELGGEAWLNGLVEQPYDTAKQQLQTLPGIGPKVADCICLMSLNKPDVIPVDTHVFQITSKVFMPELSKIKSLNNAIYKQIGDIWRENFGEYAGWAHTVLFSTQLKLFNIKAVAEKENKKRILKDQSNKTIKKTKK